MKSLGFLWHGEGEGRHKSLPGRDRGPPIPRDRGARISLPIPYPPIIPGPPNGVRTGGREGIGGRLGSLIPFLQSLGPIPVAGGKGGDRALSLEAKEGLTSR